MLDCPKAKGGSKEGDIPPATPNSPEDSCQHCQVGSGDSPVYWGIQLDDDLLETIVNIYPEWFKNCSTSPGTRCNGMAERNNGHETMTPLLSAVKAMGTASSDKCTTLTNTIAPNKPSSSDSSSSSALSDCSSHLFTSRTSPPKCQVDEASLQKAMDKNKESLKVKLMLRRPITQLVEQGILPPLKTPPAFHEQRQKLERAKMGDILKNKIQRRPDRQELIQHNILEDTTVDPSLQDKQRQLKKARLADDLNDRLSHRPGPLELVKGNILHADEFLAQAIKEGQISFKRTCEGQTLKHPPPRFIIEEDSGGSEGALSPPQDVNDTSQSSLPSVFDNNEIIATPTQQGSPPLSLFLPSINAIPSLSPGPPTTTVFAVTQAPSSILIPQTAAAAISTASQNIFGSSPSIFAQSPAMVTTVSAPSSMPSPACLTLSSSGSISNSTSNSGGSSKPRKKSKSKAQPKAKTIKFHEYKGPPSAQKSLAANAVNNETSYELLLQQQQLFLQWQLEWQQKYPQILLPAQKPSQGMPGAQLGDQQVLNLSTNCGNSNSSSPASATMIAPSPQPPQMMHQTFQQIQPSNDITPSPSPKMQTKFEDMKVSDLKAELKRRNLPVSGSKPQLIERLKPFIDFSPPAIITTNDNSHASSLSAVSNMAPTPQSMPISVLLDAGQATLTAVHPTVTLVDGASQASVGVVMGVSGAGNNSNMMNDLLVPKHSPVSPPVVEISQTTGNSNAPPGLLQDSRPPSVVPMDIDNSDNAVDSMDISVVNPVESNSSAAFTNEDIVRLQQKRIEELQRQLQRSQMQLQQHQMLQQPPNATTPPPMPITLSQLTPQPVMATISLVSSQPAQIATPAIHRQLLQQHLQQKMQHHANAQGNGNGKHQNIKPASSLPAGTLSSAAVKANLAAFLHSQHSPSNNTQTARQEITKSTRLPNGVHQKVVLTTTEPTKLITAKTEPQFIVSRPPPPDYDEATKQLNKQQFAAGVMNHVSGTRIKGVKSIKSQAVDDVLEILIKNGELPASAAQEPPTPTTPETGSKTGNNTTLPPVFPDPSSPPENNQTSNNTSNSNPTETTNTITNNKDTPVINNSNNNSGSGGGSVEERIISVQTLTAPTSNLLGDHTSETLDFDFHLDLDDMEAMDLGSVLAPQENEQAVSKDLSSINMVAVNSHMSPHHHCLDSSQPPPSLLTPSISELVGGLQDVGVSMDIELSDWLDVMIPTSSSSSCSSSSTLLAPLNCNSFGGMSSGSGLSLHNNNNHNNNLLHSYTSNHEHDPLLSNLGQQSHDPFDLFAVEDMDFKTPTDLGAALSWDKVDFATT